jgi:predicted amidohydrolase YtcJ
MADDLRNDSIALINGVIYPMSPPGRASAIFAKGGVIRAIGSDKEILSACDNKTVVLDMKGKFLMPGFTDTHNHLLATGRSLETLNLRGVSSIDELIKKGRKYFSANKTADGEWFFAHGWDQNYFAEKRFPNRYDLDKITKDVPMFFERSCGHIAVLNSKALQDLHIGKGFKISGGMVGCDENGEPTGLISEAAANWVKMNMPENPDEMLERWYERAVSEMVRFGITAVQTDDLEMAGSPERVFRLYEKMETNDRMPLRISEQWHLRDEKELQSFIENGNNKRNGPRYFTSGPLKIHIDGTLGAKTAALREEYSDEPGNRGIYTHSQGELCKLVQIAQSAGMQIAFYAIGDGAIERCLNSIEAGKNSLHMNMPGHRIVHCQVGAQDLYRRIAELGVMADIQPAFVTSDWPIVLSRLGAERARWSYAWKSLLLFGITVGAGSDAPSESLNPLVGIRAAILRKDDSNEPKHGWMPSERLDRIEAFSMYTKGGATVCGDEDFRGTLELGKAADIIAFMENPFSVEDNALPDMKVGLTVVDGKIRYIC